MNKPTYTFRTQQQKALAYEKLVCKKYKMKYVGDSKKEYDAICKGKKIELKVDFHRNNTFNFFFERWSNDNKRFDEDNYGGPWRAYKDSIHKIIYCHVVGESLNLYSFNPEKLCNHLDEIIHRFELKSVKNKGYNTLGYCVPIESITQLFTKKVLAI